MKNYKTIGLILAAIVLVGLGLYSNANKTEAPVTEGTAQENQQNVTANTPKASTGSTGTTRSTNTTATKKPSTSTAGTNTIRTVVTNTTFFPSQGLDYNLIETQSVKIPGAELTLKIAFVQDMTSAGCKGDAVACPDRVDISVSKGFNTEVATLYSPFMDGVMEEGKESATLFGYKFTLTNLKLKNVSIHVEAAK